MVVAGGVGVAVGVLPEQVFAPPRVAVVAVWNQPLPLAHRWYEGLAAFVGQVTESIVFPGPSSRT